MAVTPVATMAMYAAAGTAAAASVYSATQTPDIPKPAAPTPLAQSAQVPDAAKVGGDMSGTGQAGGSPGVAQTMLTGPGGVDPNTLSLGKNTLLGS